MSGASKAKLLTISAIDNIASCHYVYHASILKEHKVEGKRKMEDMAQAQWHFHLAGNEMSTEQESLIRYLFALRR